MVEGAPQLSGTGRPDPAGGTVTDAREFLGIERRGDDLHWRLDRRPELATPGNFLFGGCGLGAALVALEAAAGRPTVWATAQYLSYAPTGSVLDLTVTLAAEGRRVTQARAVGRSGDPEILTVNAALGMPGPLEVGGVWVTPPEVPPPDECPARRLPDFNATSIFDRIEVRLAKGRSFEEISAGDRRSRAIPTAPCGPGCPVTSSRRPPPWPSSATTSPAACPSPSVVG